MSSIKRNTLILVITGAQLAILVVAVGLFTHWLHGELTQLVGGQIQADNQVILEQTQAFVEALNPVELTEGGENWQRVQRQVEKLTVPNQGAVFLLDPQTGKLVCHPRLRVERQLRHQDFSRLQFHGETSMPFSQAKGAGWYETTDGLSFAVVGDVPGLPYKLFVRQDAGASGRAVSSVLNSARLLLIVGSLLYAVLAGFGAYELARRLEDSPERVPAALAEDAIKARNSVAFGLANLAELRDAESGHHLVRIRAFVRLLAQQLKSTHQQLRDPNYMKDLVQASTLHDLGKIGVRESILLKPGKLSVDERREMQKHTLVADCYLNAVAQHLQDDRFFQIARQVAVAHHERWDGGGYPFGLVGDQIPLAARIVALADVYDALTSRRTYRARMSFDHARDLIVKGSGVQFDPDVVEAFTHCEADFRRIAELREPPEEETADVVLLDGLRARSGKLTANKLAQSADSPDKAAPPVAKKKKAQPIVDQERAERAASPTIDAPSAEWDDEEMEVKAVDADLATSSAARPDAPSKVVAQQGPALEPIQAEMAGDPLDPCRVDEFNQRQKAKRAFQQKPRPKQTDDELTRHAALTMTAEDIAQDDAAGDQGEGLMKANPAASAADAVRQDADSASDDLLEEQLKHSVETLQLETSEAVAEKPETASSRPAEQPQAVAKAAAQKTTAQKTTAQKTTAQKTTAQKTTAAPSAASRAAADRTAPPGKNPGDPPPGTPEWMNMWQEIFHSQGEPKTPPGAGPTP